MATPALERSGTVTSEASVRATRLDRVDLVRGLGWYFSQRMEYGLVGAGDLGDRRLDGWCSPASSICRVAL